MGGINKAISFSEGCVADVSRNLRGGVVTRAYLGCDPVYIVENEGIKEVVPGAVPYPSSPEKKKDVSERKRWI